MISDYLQSCGQEMSRVGIRPVFEAWGTVLEESDTTQEGNLRVQVQTMEDQKNIFDNVPVLTAYGGTGYGLYVLPEEGDIVKLTFLGGDFLHPVATGCRMPSESTFVKEQYEKENLKKVLKLKSGSIVSFSGEEGKEKIRVSGPEKMEWELDEENEKISFGDKEQNNRMSLDKKEGKAVLKAQEEIRLECGNNSLCLKKDGTMVLHCQQLTLEADKVTVKGTNNVQLEGQNIVLKASMDMKIKSSGNIKLSAQMINLN